jgi:sugar-specific transcriptional regulator TrmB
LKGTIKKTLKNIGLSEKESEIYIFLGKRGPLKGSEISRQLKVNKGQAYRILKGLQKKGLVEATLEYPTRFTSVPFENVIDSFIKSKKEEVDQIEKSKDDLLADWKKISQTELESSLERFSVIEGEKKIFQKISQMIKETKNELVSIVSVYGLLRANHYGIFEDIINQQSKKKIKFRFLTQLSKEDLKPVKTILGKIESAFDFKGRDPDRSSTISPRIVIKDHNEILLFISDDNPSSKGKIEAVLCTNCQSIIKSFYNVFQDLWNKSSDIKERIYEIESGNPPSIMELIKNPKIAKKNYYTTLDQARKEILIVTSPKRLNEISNNLDMVKKWCKNGVSIKIMAPITTENLKATQKLLSCSEVRHISVGYRETTIIDGKTLYQFNKPCASNVDDCEILNLENVFFTNDQDFIKQTKKTLFEIWKKTRFPYESIRQITNNISIKSNPLLGYHSLEKETSFMKNMQYKFENIDEKTVLEKIEKEKKLATKDFAGWESIIRYFGSRAFATIPPIPALSLPKMVVGVVYHDKHSTFGIENWLVINIWQKNKECYGFIPVAFVQDSPKHIQFRKRIFEGFPVEKNFSIFRKGELQVQNKGKSLFVGWTREIPLGIDGLTLPAAALFFEGYGEVKPGMFTNIVPSGRKQHSYYNSFDAFVTFFHPQSKYVGSGIEGFIERENVFISTP